MWGIQDSYASIPFSLPMPLSFIPPLERDQRVYPCNHAEFDAPWGARIIPVMSIHPDQTRFNVSSYAVGP